MKLVCHIGHHKTGTTSLQVFLSQNSHALLQAGILYPWVESQGATTAVMKGLTGDMEGVLPINIREAHNALAFRMLADAIPHWKVPPYHRELPHSKQMLIALRNQMEALMPEAVVLCSEVMSHFGIAAPQLITQLRKPTEQADFKLYCTLRRPDEQLVSWHGQQIRFGQAPAPLSDPAEGIKFGNLHVDYRGVVEPWLKRIPDATFLINPYRETIADGGSIQHFVKHSGISFPENLLEAPTMNVSQPAALIPLLREANRVLPKPAAQALAHEMADLTEGLDLPGTREVEFFGPAARAQLLDYFRPIHAWLTALTGRTAFFTDLEEMAVCKPVSDSEALRQVLDQITPDHLAALSSDEARRFVTLMCDTHRGAPLP
ncbi:hypothetical protein SAMN04488103_1167 [Gemmobacter aquatilis]|uniref:Sulfotransferase family protein n=1 Tax=Gemmobacter aquatilis TaxID=933059 RepID=A0A1H8N1V4_9RHOB|nr:hypothetical protein [Gemmobacter aquatilis]SEO23496.1 hypothetical protein SAMN04488103_1167 [Gemmobacter aquatilis]